MAYTIPANVSVGGTIASATTNALLANFTAINGYPVMPFYIRDRMAPLSGLTAAAVSQIESSADAPKPNMMIASFDASADEWLQWAFIMPNTFGVALTINIPYYMASATANDVVWGAQIAAITDTDASLTAKAFAATNVATVTVPGAAGTLDVATIVLTNDDGVKAGDVCVLGLYRDANNGADTATGDANLLVGCYLSWNIVTP